jgi:hypothetical protein
LLVHGGECRCSLTGAHPLRFFRDCECTAVRYWLSEIASAPRRCTAISSRAPGSRSSPPSPARCLRSRPRHPPGRQGRRRQHRVFRRLGARRPPGRPTSTSSRAPGFRCSPPSPKPQYNAGEVAKNDHSSMTCLLTVPPAGVRVPAMKYLGPPGSYPSSWLWLPALLGPFPPPPLPRLPCFPPPPTGRWPLHGRRHLAVPVGRGGRDGRDCGGGGGWFLGVLGRPLPGERVGWEGSRYLNLQGER